ncbi:hypothetical protein ACQZ6F_27505 [Rhizobium sp. A22-96]
MLPNILFDPLFNFFTAIDRILSSDVHDNPDTDEKTITNQLLWFMNNARRPRGDFHGTVEAFKAAVRSALGDAPELGIKFETEGFSQNFEGDVTQADYAFNIIFHDTSPHVGIKNSWRATYFMQSKVAKLRDEQRGWDRYDTFSRDKPQSIAIERLREVVGDGGLRYHLYCPTEALKLVPRSLILKKLAANNPSSQILSHYSEAGFWLNHSFPSSINALFSGPSSNPTPWALFILAHFFNVRSPEGFDIQTDKLYPDETDALLENRQAIFNRDRAALELAIQQKEQRTGRKIVRHEQYFSPGPRRTISIGLDFPTLDYVKRFDHKPEEGKDDDLDNPTTVTPGGI